MQVLLTSFTAIIMAEVGDKSQVVTLCMAACHFPLQVFLGAITALTIMTALAAGFGGFFAGLFPQYIITAVSAVYFIVIGVITYLSRGNNRDMKSEIDCHNKAFLHTAGLIFLAEIGDKTQLTVISLAAVTGAPFLVFAGTMLAQIINHGLVAFMGDKILSRLPNSHLKVISAIIFIAIGAAIFILNLF